MRRSLCLTLTMAAILATLSAPYPANAQRPANAQTNAPWLVASLRSVDELYADLNYLTAAAGAGQLGQLVTMTTRQYASGLNQQSPVLLTLDSPQPNSLRWLIYLPVPDGLELANLMTPLGKIQPAGPQIWKLDNPQRPLFIQRRQSWAIVSDRVEAFATALPNANALLPRAADPYDVNLRVWSERIPTPLKQQWALSVQSRVQDQLNNYRESTPRDQLARLAVQELGQQVLQLLADVQQFSCHWNTDRNGRKVQLDFQLTAAPNTLTAQRMQQFQMQPSQMAAMLHTGGSATWNAIGRLPSQDIVRLERLLNSASQSLLAEIQSSEKFAKPEDQNAALTVTAALLETCRSSLRTGYFDGAGMMRCDVGTMSLGTAMHVSDTQPLVAAIETLANTPQHPSDGLHVQRQPASGLVGHRYLIAIPTPQDVTTRQMLGPRLNLALAMSAQRLYLAFGTQANAELSRIIDTTGKTAPQDALPFHARVRIDPLLRFLSTVGELKTASLLSSGAADGHLLMQAEPMPNGARFRLELDQDVIRAAGHFFLIARTR